MKTRRRKTTRLNRRKQATAGRARGSSAADLKEQLDQRTRELAESREQQAATSEVLQLVSRSTGDLQSVFDTLLANATRLCGAKFGTLNLFDGQVFRNVAMHNVPVSYADT